MLPFRMFSSAGKSTLRYWAFATLTLFCAHSSLPVELFSNPVPLTSGTVSDRNVVASEDVQVVVEKQIPPDSLSLLYHSPLTKIEKKASLPPLGAFGPMVAPTTNLPALPNPDDAVTIEKVSVWQSFSYSNFHFQAIVHHLPDNAKVFLWIRSLPESDPAAASGLPELQAAASLTPPGGSVDLDFQIKIELLSYKGIIGWFETWEDPELLAGRYGYRLSIESPEMEPIESAEQVLVVEAPPPPPRHIDFTELAAIEITHETAEITAQLTGTQPSDTVLLEYWEAAEGDEAVKYTLRMEGGPESGYRAGLEQLAENTRYQFRILVQDQASETIGAAEIHDFTTLQRPPERLISAALNLGESTYRLYYRWTDQTYRVEKNGFSSGYVRTGQAFNIPDNLYAGTGKQFALHFDAEGLLHAIDSGTYNLYATLFPLKRSYVDMTGKITHEIAVYSNGIFLTQVRYYAIKYSDDEIDSVESWISEPDLEADIYHFDRLPTLEEPTLPSVLDPQFKFNHSEMFYLAGQSLMPFSISEDLEQSIVETQNKKASFGLIYLTSTGRQAILMYVNPGGIQAKPTQPLRTGSYWVRGTADLTAVPRADRDKLNQNLIVNDQYFTTPQQVDFRYKTWTMTLAYRKGFEFKPFLPIFNDRPFYVDVVTGEARLDSLTKVVLSFSADGTAILKSVFSPFPAQPTNRPFPGFSPFRPPQLSTGSVAPRPVPAASIKKKKVIKITAKQNRVSR